MFKSKMKIFLFFCSPLHYQQNKVEDYIPKQINRQLYRLHFHVISYILPVVIIMVTFSHFMNIIFVTYYFYRLCGSSFPVFLSQLVGPMYDFGTDDFSAYFPFTFWLMLMLPFIFGFQRQLTDLVVFFYFSGFSTYLGSK